MKILQVIHDFLPCHQAGSELYCYHLSKGLQERGHKVRLFYSEIDHQRPNYSTRRGDYNGLPFIEFINNHDYTNFEQTYENPEAERAFAAVLDEWRPDVVHFHHLLNLSYGCARLAKERGIAVVFTLHDYWLTCPRGGGQRFRGEGLICHQVDTKLCAECISRYSVPSGKAARGIKHALNRLQSSRDPTLLSAMQKGRIHTPQRRFVQRGVCDIQGDQREVMFAHPPTQIQLTLNIPPNASLSFAHAMAPSTYRHSGDGVLFRISCDEDVVFEAALEAKSNPAHQGWHNHTLDFSAYAGKSRRVCFETAAHPNGQIDFCSACWAEPRLTGGEAPSYQPSLARQLQGWGEWLLSAAQKPRLKAQVDRRTAKTMELFQQVDLFIAPSQFLRRKFIEYGLPPERIVFSDYGIAQLHYTAKPRTPHLPIRFVYVGTLVEHKGLHVLIEAFNRLPQQSAVLDVYGSLDEFTGYVKRIQSMLHHPGIRLRGRAENHEIPRILAQADALVIPSIWFENSPITIHEAFLAQVPVITSNFGGMADLVRHEENGLLFEAGSADALYQCLQRIVDHPQILSKIRPNPCEVKSVLEDCVWMENQYRELL